MRQILRDKALAFAVVIGLAALSFIAWLFAADIWEDHNDA